MRTIAAMGTGLFLVSMLAGCNDAPGLSSQCNASSTDEPCRVFLLVNEERARAGLTPYEYDPALALSAQRHAIDMADQGYFSHTSLDGRSFSDRTEAAGYEGFPSGENIARGQTSPEQVMDSWMSSEGHRNNILSSSSNEIGVGYYESHWVQVFGQQ
jgi:uncharacterized protein YkwD